MHTQIYIQFHSLDPVRLSILGCTSKLLTLAVAQTSKRKTAIMTPISIYLLLRSLSVKNMSILVWAKYAKIWARPIVKTKKNCWAMAQSGNGVDTHVVHTHGRAPKRADKHIFIYHDHAQPVESNNNQSSDDNDDTRIISFDSSWCLSVGTWSAHIWTTVVWMSLSPEARRWTTTWSSDDDGSIECLLVSHTTRSLIIRKRKRTHFAGVMQTLM